MLFDVTSSVCNLFLRFSRLILLYKLGCNALSTVKLPKIGGMQTFQVAKSDRHLMLYDVYAVSNDFKLYLEQANDTVIRLMFDIFWTHEHYIGNVFVFEPNETTVACTVNCPETIHNSQICNLVDCTSAWKTFTMRVEVESLWIQRSDAKIFPFSFSRHRTRSTQKILKELYNYNKRQQWVKSLSEECARSR